MKTPKQMTVEELSLEIKRCEEEIEEARKVLSQPRSKIVFDQESWIHADSAIVFYPWYRDKLLLEREKRIGKCEFSKNDDFVRQFKRSRK